MPSASPLSTLDAKLIASVDTYALKQEPKDVEWEKVARALTALRLHTQEELMELTTALDRVQSLDQTNDSEEASNVLVVHSEIKSMRSQYKAVEQHLLQVGSVIHPRLLTLQNLQSRAEYLKAVVQVEELSNIAKQEALQATPDALEAFERFATYAAAIPDDYSAVRKEAIRRVGRLSMDLRQFAIEKLQQALEKIGWPEPLTTQQELVDKETELRDVLKAFAYLLNLQLSQKSDVEAATNLWAMDCVMEPLLLRFRYHFGRPESATNRLAKPEWYLHYVQDQVVAHTRFLAHALTPALHRHREELHCWDAQILMLRDYVKVASCKLTQEMHTLLAHPPLLCHTLDEVLLFEQKVDDDIGYGSWASADRRAYPRCIDVFTSSNDMLFAWTSIDAEYAHRVLASTLEAKSSEGTKDALWQLEDGNESEHYQQELIPAVALQFGTLVDFLSQRFFLMETDEHRYLYVMQVHLPLLNRFGQLCETRGSHLISKLTKTKTNKDVQNTWSELFGVVNALQYVADMLATWEQSSVFLELSRKVTRSEATRAQVLQMHLAYSKQVLARASAAVLATEEATAVRQALAGPGAMIGPTAALTAAYSVGSATMKSLFRCAETDKIEQQRVASVPPVDSAVSSIAAIDDDNEKSVNEHKDLDTLVFSHTIFERQIAELKSLASTLLEGAKRTLLRAVEPDMELYRSSSFWTETSLDAANGHQLLAVSSELANCYTLIHNVLLCARKRLVPECWPALWKVLASALDDALFDAFYNPAVTHESTRLSKAGERQFVYDIQTLVAIFVTDPSKALPRPYLRRTREVCVLLQMPVSRVYEIFKALDDVTIISTAVTEKGPIEQLTTILEACGIISLTPAQIVQICTVRLHADRHK